MFKVYLSCIFFQQLKLKDVDTNQEFHFFYDGWLGRSRDSEDHVAELPAIRPDIPPPQGKLEAFLVQQQSSPPLM